MRNMGGQKRKQDAKLAGTKKPEVVSNRATAQLAVLKGQGPAASPIPSPGRNQ